MLEKDFENSKKYLNSLIDCHKKDNIFSHLINSNEDIIKTIKRLYEEDNFDLLFDPIFNKIDNYDITIKSKTYMLNEGLVGVEIGREWLNMVRTQNYFFVLIIGSKEINYELPWFKNSIDDLINFNINMKAEEFLLKNANINLENYTEIEEEDVENYKSWDVININVDSDYWYYYVIKNAEKINQNNDDDNDDNVDDEDIE